MGTVTQVRAADVTACLVTRGDCSMHAILDSLIFDRAIIWDNSKRDNMKTYGRYAAAELAATPIVYFQDDDCIVPAETQRALLDAYEPDILTVNYGHGVDADGYDDIALFHGGAICDAYLIHEPFRRYLDHYPLDDWLLYEADFVFGCLTPHKTLHLPFEMRRNCFNGQRMCDQPWQRNKKREIADRARAIRDEAA